MCSRRVSPHLVVILKVQVSVASMERERRMSTANHHPCGRSRPANDKNEIIGVDACGDDQACGGGADMPRPAGCDGYRGQRPMQEFWIEVFEAQCKSVSYVVSSRQHYSTIRYAWQVERFRTHPRKMVRQVACV
jgi:hypothetical protein